MVRGEDVDAPRLLLGGIKAPFFSTWPSAFKSWTAWSGCSTSPTRSGSNRAMAKSFFGDQEPLPRYAVGLQVLAEDGEPDPNLPILAGLPLPVSVGG